MAKRQSRPQDLRSLLIASAFAAFTSFSAQYVNKIVTEPYMDEEFHVPQAQRYCDGDYQHYDSKLTTPPGLYLLSVFFAQTYQFFAKYLFREQYELAPCNSTAQLRYFCLVSLLILPWILSEYSMKVEPEEDVRPIIKPTSPMEALTRAEANPKLSARTARDSVTKRKILRNRRRRRGIWALIGTTLEDFSTTLEVHTLSLLPPLWFFGFLYYTDVPSTLTVICTIIAAQKRRLFLASLFGGLSLTFRQTNIVWIFFSMGISVLDRLDSAGVQCGPLCNSSIKSQGKSLLTLSSKEALAIVASSLLPFAPVIVGAAAFVYWNGSIVLGDHEHHKLSPHWAQPWYGIALASFFAWPSLLLPFTREKYRRQILEWKPLIITSVCALAAIHYGTVTHPFILADNRHYAFYVWRKIIHRTEWAPYLLGIPYAILARVWWINLALHKSFFWLVGFVFCFSIAVIPSPLIEPRYFLIPYLISRLELGTTDELRSGSRRIVSLSLEAGWAILINIVTLYLFLYRPFHWSDTTAWQRFMW